ncbi:ATP phosphoribosyltransferase regulatory subunit [Gilvimarinus xylanilyticus]|uniref:ATP phosphoribosyltransferase regulatory subunit n=1 Tax=Gilvimarinus xylanilyticus TaxID=2944139 RepID=A0A9X2HYT7_9GAMM|nr:ATP phosphoribosyltransferase regulatory subunit [Gilvimarinus xylanilyticus]MCP8900918.1 ATP phosphoribosyltransferase regulatory subunit [Gilvimarinus xylanilyticus]
MTYADRWLLPDGIEEILPDEARPIELLRRKLLELYRSWGYEMVIPPLLEYTDSLLIGLGRDVDLLTFKMTDQLSGRTLGIRADITPQTARMDAHSYKREGANRLCYAGHVVHTRPKNPLATRTPIQAGLELYGDASTNADGEVVSLLLESLRAAGLPKLHIDLGHVGIYRSLMAKVDVDEAQKDIFFAMLQRKAVAEMNTWVAENITDKTIAKVLLALPALAGGREILSEARTLFAAVASDAVNAVDELAAVADIVAARYPEAELYFDLGELRGYHYLTGIVFAAFAPGYGNPIASGGRYDHIGEVFGRRRPATGFAVDITALSKLGLLSAAPSSLIGYSDEGSDAQWQAVAELRARGERVVAAGSRTEMQALGCDQVLVKEGDAYTVASL